MYLGSHLRMLCAVQGLYLDNPRVVDALAGGAAGRFILLPSPQLASWSVHHLRCFELDPAGGTTAVFVSPLEVLKTRLQTQVKGQGTKYLGGIHIYGTFS